MSVNRLHLIAAGALVTVTALAGIAARGTGLPVTLPDPSRPHTTSFSAGSSGPVRFTGTLDRTAVQRGRDGIARMELVISAAADASRSEATPVRRPTDLVVVLDRSGSMMGDKIVHARAAVLELLGHLDAQDRFGLVTYSDEASTHVELLPVTEERRTNWRAQIAALGTDGGTNMSAGLDAGLRLIEQGRAAGRVPRLMLISDGLANQGDASFEGLTGRARRAARDEYMLSTIGVGADFNEELMTALADAGTGNYYYVADARELSHVFAREFDAARTTVASGLAVRIAPGAGVQVLDAAGYPLETADGVVSFRPGALFAGQERRIWVTLAVPQSAVGEYALGTFGLEYQDQGGRRDLRFTDVPRIACVATDEEFYAGVDVDTWGRGIEVDAYYRMQAEVAQEVKSGKREDAQARASTFMFETEAMNTYINSPRAADAMERVSKLQDEIELSFRGDNQPERQKLFSKAAGAASVDARRAGAKK